MTEIETHNLAVIEILKGELEDKSGVEVSRSSTFDKGAIITKILVLAENISPERLLNLEGKSKIGEVLKEFGKKIPGLNEAFQKYCDSEELITEWLVSSKREKKLTEDNFLPKYVNFDSLFPKLLDLKLKHGDENKILKDFLDRYPEQRLDIMRNVTKYGQFNELRFEYGLSSEQTMLLQNLEFDKIEKPFDMPAAFSALNRQFFNNETCMKDEQFIAFLQKFPEDRREIVECIPHYLGDFKEWELFREKFMSEKEIEAYRKFTDLVGNDNGNFENAFEEIMARKELFIMWVEDSGEIELNLLDEFLEELLYFVATNSKHSELTELVSLGLEINSHICWDFCIEYPCYPVWKKLAEALCVKVTYILGISWDNYYKLIPFFIKMIEDLGPEKILEEKKKGAYINENMIQLCKSFIHAKKFEELQAEQGKLLPRK